MRLPKLLPEPVRTNKGLRLYHIGGPFNGCIRWVRSPAPKFAELVVHGDTTDRVEKYLTYDRTESYLLCGKGRAVTGRYKPLYRVGRRLPLAMVYRDANNGS